MQLNKTKEDLTRLRTDGLRLQNSFDTKINATTTQLSSLLSSMNTLNKTDNDFMTELNTLGSSVNSADNLFDTQLNSLQFSINSRLNSLQSSVSSLNTANGATTTQLNSLQSSVGSLTSQVNSPVNLYQNCIQETRSCTGTSGSAYWKNCTTSHLPVNKLVSCPLRYNYIIYMLYTCRDTTHWAWCVSMTHHHFVMTLVLFAKMGHLCTVFVWLYPVIQQDIYSQTSPHLPAQLSSRGAPPHRTLFEQT